MHICIFSDRYPPHGTGGASNIASSLAEQYVEFGHTVSVVTTVRDRENAGTDHRNGVQVESIRTPQYPRLRAYYGIYNPYVIGELGSILDRLDPDVVHAHNVHEFLSYHSLSLAKRRSLPVVLTLHDLMTVEYGKLTHFLEYPGVAETGKVPDEAYEVNPWRQLKENRFRYFPLRNTITRRYLNRKADEVVAVSGEQSRALSANGIECSRVIHNGIDVDEFRSGGVDETSFRETHGLGDALTILFGGRVSYAKGGQHLAKAFARVAERLDEEVRLVVASDRHSYVDRMRNFADPHGDAVVATGWLDAPEMKGAYRTATVVATPSLCLDCFPTMNLESMAMATPVVTSVFGGGTESISAGETGMAVNPFKVDELASALYEFLSDTDVARRFGRNGLARVKDEFTLSDQVDEYIWALKDLQ